MSRGINKVILVGNLGADPETRYIGSGTAVCNIRIATSEKWKDKEGNDQERTEWHSIVMFGKLAEIADEYCEKGKQVYIEGSLRTEKYEKDGVERYSTKIYADTMQLLGGGSGRGERSEREEHSSRSSDKSRSSGQRQGGGQDPGEGSPRERAQRAASAGARDQAPVQNDTFDDDYIHF